MDPAAVSVPQCDHLRARVAHLEWADAVLVLGGLGFLGLGLPESTPEWGGDLQQAMVDVPIGVWWTALFPGLAMFVLVLGLSFLGEGLEALLSAPPQRHP